MKIGILTIGTRGDVQPFIALGRGLKAAGHEVTLCTAATFENFVTENGLQYAYMNDELIRLMDTAEGKGAMEGKRGSGFGLIAKAKPILRKALDEAWEASQGAELLVYHPKTLAGYHIAEKLQIPVFLSLPLPAYTATREFPNPILGANLPLGGVFNRWSYSITRMAGAMYGDVINNWREKIGLPPRGRFGSEMILPNGQPMPTLYCYSPFFGDQPFWGQRVYELGVGTQPIPQKKLTAENLRAAVRTVGTDAEMQHRAESLGEKIRAEDGVARAVEIIERVGQGARVKA